MAILQEKSGFNYYGGNYIDLYAELYCIFLHIVPIQSHSIHVLGMKQKNVNCEFLNWESQFGEFGELVNM